MDEFQHAFVVQTPSHDVDQSGLASSLSLGIPSRKNNLDEVAGYSTLDLYGMTVVLEPLPVGRT